MQAIENFQTDTEDHSMDEEDRLYLNSQPDGRVVLSTSRLEIRELVRKNAASVLQIISDCPENAFLPDLATGDELLTGALIAGKITDQYRFFGYGLWGVFYRGQLAGLAVLKNGSVSGTGEIGYAILKEYRRQGLMTEAMLAIVEYAHEQGFFRVQINASSENTVSRSFFENLRNKYHALHPDIQETFVDSLSFTL